MLKVLETVSVESVFSGKDVQLQETPNGNLCFVLDGENYYVRKDDESDIDSIVENMDEWSIKTVISDDVEDAVAFKIVCHQRPWKSIKTFSFKKAGA